jgi:hypothetical protein
LALDRVFWGDSVIGVVGYLVWWCHD